VFKTIKPVLPLKPSATMNISVLEDRVFFLGRIFRNLAGNRKSRYPARNPDTAQKNSVKFEFHVQNKGLHPGVCILQLVRWPVVVANVAAGSRRLRVRVILPSFFIFRYVFSV
jgi:hypothetical protein